MKILSASLTLLFFASSDSRAEDSKAIQLGPGYVACGEMTRFWRGKPIIGRWMGQGSLADAPTFYNQSSFPYKKRRYKQEVEMADFLTTPRLLGIPTKVAKANSKNTSTSPTLTSCIEKKMARSPIAGNCWTCA